MQDQILRNVLEEARRGRPHAGNHLGADEPGNGDSMFDRVMVFDRGQLVEDGTHETLLAENGIFKELAVVVVWQNGEFGKV